LGVVISGGGYVVKLGIFLFGNASFLVLVFGGGTVNWLVVP